MMLAMKLINVFVKERFVDGSTYYFAPIKKLNIDTVFGEEAGIRNDSIPYKRRSPSIWLNY